MREHASASFRERGVHQREREREMHEKIGHVCVHYENVIVCVCVCE